MQTIILEHEKTKTTRTKDSSLRCTLHHSTNRSYTGTLYNAQIEETDEEVRRTREKNEGENTFHINDDVVDDDDEVQHRGTTAMLIAVRARGRKGEGYTKSVIFEK